MIECARTCAQSPEADEAETLRRQKRADRIKLCVIEAQVWKFKK